MNTTQYTYELSDGFPFSGETVEDVFEQMIGYVSYEQGRIDEINEILNGNHTFELIIK